MSTYWKTVRYFAVMTVASALIVSAIVGAILVLYQLTDDFQIWWVIVVPLVGLTLGVPLMIMAVTRVLDATGWGDFDA